MRKYISFMITAVLLVALFVFPAAAAETGMLAISDVSGRPGETVTMDVELSQNPGLVTMSIKVEYDAEVLQLTGVKDNGVLAGARLNAKYNSPYTITWVDGAAKENNTKNGAIATFQFQINKNAPAGKSPVTLIFMDSYSTDYTANQFAVQSGSVTVGNKDSSQNEGNIGNNTGNGGQGTPAETTPATTAPVETTPAQTTPAVSVPVETTPAQTTPATTTPVETAPEQATSATTPPVETAPEQATSVATEPEDITPVQTAPTEMATEESKDEVAQNPESGVITIGTIPAEKEENQQNDPESDVITIGPMPDESTEDPENDPVFPWWVLLVLIPGIGIAAVLVIKKIKK